MRMLEVKMIEVNEGRRDKRITSEEKKKVKAKQKLK